MFCAKCGKENDDDHANCVACGASLSAAPQGPREHVPNHLV